MPPQVDADRNLLFGVLALLQDFIDVWQFADACSLWAVGKDRPLGDVLVEQGRISEADRQEIERFLARKLKKHGGDVRVSLAAAANPAARDAIKAVDDPDVRATISTLPPAAGYVLAETLLKPEGTRSRYTLTRLHAMGGLGKVWLAHDTELNREVALKEIKPEVAGHPEMWRRFLKEAQVTGQLEHPNIVPVYELARRPEDGHPFYTMRFVRGRTLREAIAEHHKRRVGGAADPVERLKLLQAFVSVCQAIGFAHSRGVIHRDLKPGNVVLGEFGEVIVLDWGLAKTLDPDDPDAAPAVSLTDEARAEATRAGRQLGTPAYMAPEQADGRPDLVDARTDIYGLGSILFETLTGHPPHKGNDGADMVRRVATGETPRAREAEPSTPRALDAICAKAMALERTDRYASARELAEDIERWLADTPVSTYRDPLLTRLFRWVRRNSHLTIAAAIFTITAIGALSLADLGYSGINIVEAVLTLLVVILVLLLLLVSLELIRTRRRLIRALSGATDSGK
jgi:serine/threonine protein kinase